MKKLLSFLTTILLLQQSSQAQVGVGTATPHASAQLDVTATNKGFLMPRVTSAQRSAIASPAKGLLVFQTDGTQGFYWYSGSSWKLLNGTTTSTSGWGLKGNAGIDTAVNFIGTTDSAALRFKVAGQSSGMVSARPGDVTAWGFQAGASNTATGMNNTAVGYQSFLRNTTGDHNAAFGSGSLWENVGGSFNTAVGTGALRNNKEGNSNTGLGYYATVANPNLNHATAIGALAYADCNHCMVLGPVAGYNGTNKSINVGIGTVNPTQPLSFGNGLGGKISMYTPGDSTHYGIGVQSGLLQLYTDVVGGSVAFGYGSSEKFVEAMRIQGNGAVGIGTNAPASSALLDLSSTNRGFLMPRMTKVQREGIWWPKQGLMVYQIDNTPGFYFFDGTDWQMLVPNSSAWGLKGNSGTTSDHFIGTTNMAPLIFKVGNTIAGQLDAFNYNTSFGRETLKLNMGYNNSAFGTLSLQNNNGGNYNTAVGAKVLTANSAGNNNTGLGAHALTGNTTGNNNTATGFNALYLNTTGIDNTALGSGALYENTTGSQNTAIGYRAKPITANLNNATAIGANASVGCSNCMVLGSVEGVSAATSSVNVGIGNAYPSQPLSFGNKLGGKVSFYTSGNGTHYGMGVKSGLYQFYTDFSGADIAFGYGSSDLFTETMRIKGNGNVGIGTTNPTYKLHVNGSVAGVGAYSNVSDSRFKKDVAQLKSALNKVLQIRGVSYNWRNDEFPQMNFDRKHQIGFIAQELQQVLPEAVTKDSASGYYSIAYSTVIPVLVEAVKEQQQIIDAQQKELDLLRKEAAAFKKDQAVLNERMGKIEALLQKNR